MDSNAVIIQLIIELKTAHLNAENKISELQDEIKRLESVKPND